MIVKPSIGNTRLGLERYRGTVPVKQPKICRSSLLVPCAQLKLEPCGDGDTSHLVSADNLASIPALDLNPGLYELGRVDTADLIVPLPTVSARHAVVRVEEDQVTVTDLGSTNGTYIDGEQLKPMAAVSALQWKKPC